MRNRVSRLFALVVLLLVAAPSVLAEDRIRLKNGREIRGRIVEETEEAVTVEQGGGRIVLLRSRILEIHRGEGGPAEPTEPKEPPAEKPRRDVAKGSFLLYGPGHKLRGWRRTQVYDRGDERLYQSETVFLAAPEKQEARVRLLLVEVAGPGHVARAFTYREQVEGKPEFLRRGEIRGNTMRLTEARLGSLTNRSVPYPSEARLPSSARALALARPAETEGDLETPVFDPIRGDFATVLWSRGDRETVEFEGGQIEVTVLRSVRGSVRSEERIAPDGRTVSAELNGPSLVAIAVDPSRIERLQAGERPVEGEADRHRHRHVDLDGGFSIRKPGASWTFQAGSGIQRVTLKNVRTFAYVDVLRDASLPRGTRLETFALNLQRRLSAESDGFRKDSDGYGTLGGERSYFLICRCRRKGEEIRSLVVATIHRDVGWILIAACPVDYFSKARPTFDRIAESFEFLD